MLICVKGYLRVCPPSIVTEAELDDVVGRLDAAIAAAERGAPLDIDIAASSSLAAADPFDG